MSPFLLAWSTTHALNENTHTVLVIALENCHLLCIMQDAYHIVDRQPYRLYQEGQLRRSDRGRCVLYPNKPTDRGRKLFG